MLTQWEYWAESLKPVHILIDALLHSILRHYTQVTPPLNSPQYKPVPWPAQSAGSSTWSRGRGQRDSITNFLIIAEIPLALKSF